MNWPSLAPTQTQTIKTSAIKIENLPTDLIIFISSFLDYKSFLNFESTCKQFWKLLPFDGRNSYRLLDDFQMLFYKSRCESILLNIARKTAIGDSFFLVPANLKCFVKSNFIDLYKYFLDKIDDESSLDYIFNHVVVHANQPNSTKFVKLLLDRGITIPNLSYYMMESIMYKNLSCVELFFECGKADPNYIQDGVVAFFVAAEGGLEYVELFVKYGVDVNIRGTLGENVLTVAQEWESFEYLLRKGVDVNNVMVDGRSLLNLAA